MNLNRAKTEFEKRAKESLEVRDAGDSVYAFGSELACLCLFDAHLFRGLDTRRKFWNYIHANTH